MNIEELKREHKEHVQKIIDKIDSTKDIIMNYVHAKRAINPPDAENKCWLCAEYIEEPYCMRCPLEKLGEGCNTQVESWYSKACESDDKNEILECSRNIRDCFDALDKEGISGTYKKLALAAYLDCDFDDIDENSDGTFSYGKNHVYLIYSDSEADNEITKILPQILWTLDPKLFIEAAKLPLETRESIFLLQNYFGVHCNITLNELIKDFEGFVKHVIGIAGRGSFLSNYDGGEIAYNDLFLYRLG